MDGVIRYRMRWRQLVAQTLPMMLFLPLTVRPSGVLDVVAALFLLSAVVCFLRMYHGVDLRSDALVMYGLRRRVVPWSRITWIQPSTMLGGRYVSVVFDGRSWMLRAPTHAPFLAPDPGFEAKLDTIMRTWVAHRGDAWAAPGWPAGWYQQPVT